MKVNNMSCPGRQGVTQSECKYETLQKVYEALGWQGGTIHQVITEIKRLRTIECDIKFIKSYMEKF